MANCSEAAAQHLYIWPVCSGIVYIHMRTDIESHIYMCMCVIVAQHEHKLDVTAHHHHLPIVLHLMVCLARELHWPHQLRQLLELTSCGAQAPEQRKTCR